MIAQRFGRAFGVSRHCAGLLFAVVATAAVVIASATSALAGPATTVALPSCSKLSVEGFVGPFPATSGTAMRQFLGIPYAAAPTGAKRWTAPQAHPCPSKATTLAAKAFADYCPQSGETTGTSEGCLYLNIFTPNDSATHPVMFWIYGGSFISGASNYYNPVNLVSQGVIVVTFNYRLGALGFLAEKALDDVSKGDTGNYGIEDQQAALRWVQANIAAFGGEKTNVTVFGESAGGISTFIHLVSPKSAGLFSRAISESGAISYFLTDEPTLAQAETLGQNFAKAVGCTTGNVAACLRNLPVATILNDQSRIFPIANVPAAFPNVDGVVLTGTIQQVLQSGEFNKVPLLNGTNHDEYRYFISEDPQFGKLVDGNFDDNIAPDGTTFPGVVHYTNALEDIGVPRVAVKSVEAVYPGGSTDYSANAGVGAVGTDDGFSCSAIFADGLVSDAHVTVYAYEFNDENAPRQSYAPPIVTHDGKSFPYGAYHTAELQYLFLATPSLLSASQTKLSQAMVSYWTNFAKTGNPNAHGLPNWPQFASTQDLLSLVPPTPATETSASFNSTHQCAFWAKLSPPVRVRPGIAGR